MNDEMITPKHETLIKIDSKLQQMKDNQVAKKIDNLNIMGEAKVLPPVSEAKDKLRKKLDRHHAVELIDIMDRDELKRKQLYKEDYKRHETPTPEIVQIDEKTIRRINAEKKAWEQMIDPDLLKMSI